MASTLPLRHSLAMPWEWFIRYPLRHAINVALCPECGEENKPNRRIRQLDIPFGALFRRITGGNGKGEWGISHFASREEPHRLLVPCGVADWPVNASSPAYTYSRHSGKPSDSRQCSKYPMGTRKTCALFTPLSLTGKEHPPRLGAVLGLVE